MVVKTQSSPRILKIGKRISQPVFTAAIKHNKKIILFLLRKFPDGLFGIFQEPESLRDILHIDRDLLIKRAVIILL